MTRRVQSAAPAPGAVAGGHAPDEAMVLAGIRFLRTFDGLEPTPHILAAIRGGRASGVTLFRASNVASPTQLREACAALQAARPVGDPPLIIGLDQEGGQLQAVGYGATAWPGNLALGAARSEDLAMAAGAAIGAEAAAMGATLVFGPVCDVLEPAAATPLGTRSFGSDPLLVARLAAAMTRGLQDAGVAAVLKHFPGHGAATGDSHEAMPVVEGDAADIRARDLPPFRAAIAAGALAVMPGHLAVPALTDGRRVAATYSSAILEVLLRIELGFGGVTISDALNMGGAGGTSGLGAIVVDAAEAGMDLLLLAHPAAIEDDAVDALADLIRSGRADLDLMVEVRDRIHGIRGQLARVPQPPVDVVGCAAHRELAQRIAAASVTLVRDPGAVLPLRLRAGARVALVAPHPVDLTPAETSSYLRLGLAQALRDRGVAVDELVLPLDPTPAQVAALGFAAGDADFVLVGTLDATGRPGQAAAVHAVSARQPAVAVALRSPYDAATFPSDATTVCTYGIQQPQMEALADALLGRIPFAGSLPVRLPTSVPGGPPGRPQVLR